MLTAPGTLTKYLRTTATYHHNHRYSSPVPVPAYLPKVAFFANSPPPTTGGVTTCSLPPQPPTPWAPCPLFLLTKHRKSSFLRPSASGYKVPWEPLATRARNTLPAATSCHPNGQTKRHSEFAKTGLVAADHHPVSALHPRLLFLQTHPLRTVTSYAASLGDIRFYLVAIHSHPLGPFCLVSIAIPLPFLF